MYGVNSDNWAEILQNGLASDSVNDLIQSKLPFTEHDYYAECVLEAQLAAAAQDSTAFQRAWDSLKVDFRHNFMKHCEHIKELLTIDCEQSEFLYTLYYYDQADNLIRTVPPAGVDVIQNQTTLENIAQYRYNISRYDTLLLGHTIPEHKMVTNFRYNTRVLKHETVIRRYPFSADVPPLSAGLRHYEHTDHLGNVVAVSSDRHFQTNDGTEIDCRFSADYYPFGLLVPTRYYPDIPYRYGFNGQEKEDEVYGLSSQF